MKRCPLCARSFDDSERFCSEHALPLVPEPTLAGHLEGELTGHVLAERYQLGGIVGVGGMGTVYDAHDLRIGRRCAAKLLLPELVKDIKMRRRLLREIQATSQIRHPNVIEILDYGEDERAGAYLLMEYLTGRPLDAVVAEYPALSLCFCVAVVVQLCDALSAIHAAGLLHCDLKPSNIFLLPSGSVKVLDFGLVKPYGDESAAIYRRITTGVMAFGTPTYMSPEQAGYDPIDPRTDLYSLGVILYEMLLNQPPFEGKSAIDIIEGHRHKPVPLPRQVNPTVVLPAALELLLLKLLSKIPGQRPGSAAELSAALRDLAHGLQLDLASVDLGPVAAGASPDPEPTRAVELTLPIPAPSDAFGALVKVATERKDKLIEQVIVRLRGSIPRYRTLDPARLRQNLSLWLSVFIQHLGQHPPKTLPEELEQLITIRNREHFSATELLGAFWLGYWAARPLLREVTGGDLARYQELENSFDQRILPFYMRLAERFVEQFNQNLTRTNELLARQNEELLELRNQLNDQLRMTHQELVGAERVKARVADAIGSGLVLVDRRTRAVLLFNRAAEQLSGLCNADVIGRPVDESFHLLDGIPFDEFIEQVRDHGEVGLRKLRVRFPTGSERTIYLRGHPCEEGEAGPGAVLFVVDDVTEREKIIESFSRYVSREVSRKILRDGRPPRAEGDPRRAVLLAAGLRGQALAGLAHEEVVDLLDQFIRALGDAVFHNGGVIDSLVGECALVYFANRGQECRAPVEAAGEICRRVARLSARRVQQGRAPLGVGIGLHAGEVLVVNVGGERGAVHTILGQPAELARALQTHAGAGEVLITTDVAADLPDPPSVPELQRRVVIEGLSEPLDVMRVPVDLDRPPEA